MATVSKLGLDDGVLAGLNAAALRRRMAAVADDRDLARRVFEARGNPELVKSILDAAITAALDKPLGLDGIRPPLTRSEPAFVLARARTHKTGSVSRLLAECPLRAESD